MLPKVIRIVGLAALGTAAALATQVYFDGSLNVVKVLPILLSLLFVLAYTEFGPGRSAEFGARRPPVNAKQWRWGIAALVGLPGALFVGTLILFPGDGRMLLVTLALTLVAVAFALLALRRQRQGQSFGPD